MTCNVSFKSHLHQVSISAEHQDFFIFLQRLVSPVLEAYSGAAIFIHSLIQPTPESDYTQKLFRYLLTRTERGLAVYGDSTSFNYLVALHFPKSVFWHNDASLRDPWKMTHFILMALLSLPGESATHYLVQNTVRTFKELGVRRLQSLECFAVSGCT